MATGRKKWCFLCVKTNYQWFFGFKTGVTRESTVMIFNNFCRTYTSSPFSLAD